MPTRNTVETDVLEGQIARVIFRGKGSFVILKLKNGWVAKGEMTHPSYGVSYEFQGHWQNHRAYGRQFAFDSFKSLKPTSIEAIKEYLYENAKWIGPKIANALIAQYGIHALEVCKTNPEKVASEIRGLTMERACQVQNMLLDQERSEAMMIELKTLMHGVKVSKRSIGKIIDKYRSNAVDEIKMNPYRLISDIEGIGFLTADAIAERVGFAKDSSLRIKYGMQHILIEASRGPGHTCLPRSDLIEHASELLQVRMDAIVSNLDQCLKEGFLSVREDNVYIPQHLFMELEIAADIKRLMAGDPIQPSKVPSDALAPDQLEAINKAVENPVFILTGAPGTGKSYSLKALIHSFPGANVALCAPTGKAAKRMAEYTGMQAKTIHSLLEPNHELKFTRNEKDPLEEHLIIVDEASMLDTYLLSHLLRAIKTDSRVVFVGDIYQLPSIGAGNVLRDLIDSGVVPSSELSVIKRQDAGNIIHNCHKIKNGNSELAIDHGRDSDFFFLGGQLDRDVANTIVDLVQTRLPKHYGVNPLSDIQVITALRERGRLSCKCLNELLQDKLNPGPFPHKNVVFKLGDKVINKKNHYDAGIINGDIGFVVDIEVKSADLIIEFDNPQRTVRVDLFENDLQLAYAITVHSYQGSEAPIIVIPVHKSMGFMIPQRNWLYTAISRAQKVCVLVGQKSEVAKIVGRNKQIVRCTGLKKFLKEAGHERQSPKLPGSHRHEGERSIPF